MIKPDKFAHSIALPDHELIVGILDIPGAGRRVATWDGLESRHMSAAAARRLAEGLMAGETAQELRPVSEALLDTADRVDGPS